MRDRTKSSKDSGLKMISPSSSTLRLGQSLLLGRGEGEVSLSWPFRVNPFSNGSVPFVNMHWRMMSLFNIFSSPNKRRSGAHISKMLSSNTNPRILVALREATNDLVIA